MNFHTLLNIFDTLKFPHQIYDKSRYLGLKKTKKSHRNLSSYTWDKDECINFVKNTTEKTMLNFSELARTHKLRNLQGKKFCM